MAKQLNVNMSFTANTSKAKSQIQDLYQTLTNIQKIGTYKFDDQSLRKGQEAAAQLKQHLDAAVNVKTGKLDLNKFSQSLNKAGQDLNGLYAKLSEVGPEGQQAFLKLAQSINMADNATLNLGAKLNSLKKTFANTLKWQISSSVLHALIGSVRSAYSYAQDLNKSLNNIRIVTGQNADAMDKFAEKANKAAKALSATTLDYTRASLIYYQQGLSDQEVEERTNTTIKMANVSRQSAEEVSSQMTAIWNNFDDGSKKLEYYGDVITALGATTASSSTEIATGLEKFAAVAGTIGLSYEKATAGLATVVAKTRQDADTVGTGFRTLFARFESLKMGETIDDDVGLTKYSKALKAYGVDVLDVNGKLKDADDILDSIAEKWQTLDQTQKVALATTVGGVRQYANLIALFDNWDDVEKNMATAFESEGTLQEQADIYAESWEAAQDRVKASLESIYQDLLNDDAFITITNVFAKFLNVIDNVIDGMGGLKSVLLLIGSIIAQKYAMEMPRILTSLAQNFQVINGAAEKTKVQIMSQTTEILKLAQADSQAKGILSTKYFVQQKISDLTLQLIQNEKKMSQEEKAALKQRIQMYEMLGETAVETAKKIQQANRSKEITSFNRSYVKQDLAETIRYKKEEEIPALDKEYVKNVQNLGTRWPTPEVQQQIQQLQNQQAEKLKEINTEIERYQRLLDGLNSKNVKVYDAAVKEIQDMQKQYVELGTKLQTAKQLAQQLKQTPIKLDTSEGQDSLRQMTQTLEEQGIISTQTKNKWLSYIDEVNSGSMTAAEALNKIIRSLNGISGRGSATFAELRQTLHETGAPLDTLDAHIIENKENLLTLLAAYRGMGVGINGFQRTVASTSTALTTLSSVLMQVSMAFNALKNIGNIWSQKDLSTGEKILQTFSAFSMLLPVVITLTKKETATNLLGLFVKQSKAKANIEEATTEAVATAATEAHTKAQAASNAVMMANPVGIVIASLMVLATVILAVVSSLDTANKRLERAKENLEDTKTKFEDLKSSLSSISDQESAIDAMTEKTVEWNQAVLQLNQSILELLELHPQLAAAVKNINGHLSIDTNSKAYQDFMTQQLLEYNAALTAYSNAAIEVNEKNIQKSTKALTKVLKKSLSENSSINVEDIANQLISGEIQINELIDMKGFDTDKLGIYYNTINEYLDKIIGYQKDNNVLQESIYHFQVAQSGVKSYDELTGDEQALVDNYLSKTGAAVQLTEKEKRDILEKYFRAHGSEYIEQYGSAQAWSFIYDTGQFSGRFRVSNGEDDLGDLGVETEEDMDALAAAMGLSFETMANDVAIPLSINQEKIEEAVGLLSTALSEITDPKQREAIAHLYETQDFSSLSNEQIAQMRTGLGVITNEQAAVLGFESADAFWEAFNSAVQTKGNYQRSMANVNAIKEIIAATNKELAKLKIGDTVDAIGKIPEGLRHFFEETEEGTFKLITDTETFKEALFQNNIASALESLQALYDASIRYIKSENHELFEYEGEMIQASLTFQKGLTEEEIQTQKELANTITKAANSYEQLSLAKEELSKYILDETVINNAYQQGLIDLATAYETCTKELQNYQFALMHGTEETIKASQAQLELSVIAAESATKFGLDAKQLESYSKQLLSNEKGLKNDAKAAVDLAVANTRLNKGIESLAKNLNNNLKALKTSAKNSSEYAEAMEDVKTSLADIYNITDSSLLSDTFITDLINDGDKLKKIADGDIETINNLQMAVAKDIATNIAESIGTDEATAALEGFLSQLEGLNDLEVGQIMSDEFVNSLNKLIEATGMTKDSITSILGSMGMSANLHTDYKDQEHEVPEYTTHHEVKNVKQGITEWTGNGWIDVPTSYDEVVYTTITNYKKVTEKVPVYSIETASGNTKSGGGITYTGRGNVNASNKGAYSSGSGSSSNPKKQKTKSKSNVAERYKEVNDSLSRVTNAMEKANDEADRLWGANRLKNIEKQNKLLKEQSKLLEQKKSEAKAYLQEDLQDLVNAAAELGWQIELNEYGDISNYTASMEAIFDKYNELESYWANPNNFYTSDDQSTYKEKNIDPLWEKIETLKEAISNYDETNQLVQDLDKELRDAFYSWQDNNAEALSYQLELRLKLNDKDLQEVENRLKLLGDNVFKRAESFATILSRSNSDNSQLFARAAALTQNLTELKQAYANNEISESAYIEQLESIQDEAQSLFEELLDYREEVLGYYAEVVDQVDEELDWYTELNNHFLDTVNHYEKVIELLGKNLDYDLMSNIIDKQLQIQKNQLEINQAREDAARVDYEQALNDYNYYLSIGDSQRAQEIWDSTLKVATDRLKELENATMDSIEAVLELANKKLDNALAQAKDKIEQAFTQGHGFDFLSNTMSLASTYQDQYLTKTNQLYETNKLLNQLQKDINNTTNAGSKQRLSSFSKEIEQLQNQNELSQFDLQIAQARYEQMKAQIALQESQNSHSLVRLQRDSEGNYGYVYTANQDKIAEAEQNLADKTNALYNIALQAANDYTQKMIDLDKALTDELSALAENRKNMTEKEYNYRYNEIVQKYAAIRNSYMRDRSQALYWLEQTAATDITEAWAMSYNTNIVDMEEWSNNVDEYLTDINNSYETWHNEVDPYLESYGERLDGLTESSDALKQSLMGEDGLLSQYENQIGIIQDATNAWIDQNQAFEDLITTLVGDNGTTGLIGAINEIVAGLAVMAIQAQETESALQDIPKAVPSVNGSSSGSSNSGSGPNGSNNGSGPSENNTGGILNFDPKTSSSHGITYKEIENDDEYHEKIIDGYGKIKEKHDYENIFIAGSYYICKKCKHRFYPYGNNLNGNNLIGYRADPWKMIPFASGGYTGSWGPAGRLAMLHEKELVLNQQDTKNILASVDIIRQITSAIDLRAAAASANFKLASPTYGANNQMLEQQVTIYAEFPNAVNHTEIEEAFNNLVGRASQYANRYNNIGE